MSDEKCPNCNHGPHSGFCGKSDGFTPSGCRCVYVAPAASEEGTGTRPDADKITKHVFDKWGPLLSRPEMADDYKAPVASVEGQRTGTWPSIYPADAPYCPDIRPDKPVASVEGQQTGETEAEMTKSVPRNPSPTPWDFSTWGWYCDTCHRFFDSAELGVANDYDGYIAYGHKACESPARYIGYVRESSVPDVEGMGAREQFEKSTDFVGYTFNKEENGDYSDRDTYHAYLGWLGHARSLGGAGREQEHAPCPECDGTCFISKGKTELTCLHCYLAAGREQERSIIQVGLGRTPDGKPIAVLNLSDRSSWVEIEEYDDLREQIRRWESWGIVEIAVRNQNVSDYIEHWEGRTLAAESRNEKLVACLRKLATWQLENKFERDTMHQMVTEVLEGK